MKRGCRTAVKKIEGVDCSHYVYRHIRLDKNQPFYIGVGTNNRNHLYQRAFNPTKRNIFWKRITEKSDYRVEIIFESTSYSEVLEKEIEFIKMYGRVKNGGILSNLTDGGEGELNRQMPPSFSKEQSIRLTGKKQTEATINKRRLALQKSWQRGHLKTDIKPIFQYSLSGDFVRKWDKRTDVKKYLPKVYDKISERLKIGKYYCRGYIWFYEYKGDNTDVSGIKFSHQFKIKKYDLNGHLICIYNTSKEASIDNTIGKNRGIVNHICQACKSETGIYLNYIWRYDFREIN